MQGTGHAGLANMMAAVGGRIGRPSPLALGAIAVFVGLIAVACGGGGGGFDDERVQSPPDLAARTSIRGNRLINTTASRQHRGHTTQICCAAVSTLNRRASSARCTRWSMAPC